MSTSGELFGHDCPTVISGLVEVEGNVFSSVGRVDGVVKSTISTSTSDVLDNEGVGAGLLSVELITNPAVSLRAEAFAARSEVDDAVKYPYPLLSLQ